MIRNSNRTLTDLREKYSGRIYIFCETEDDFWDFLEDAEREGYHIGTHKPTHIRSGNTVVTLGSAYNLSLGGGMWAHMAYRSSKGNVHRVNYAKYRNGELNYLISLDEIDRIREEQRQLLGRVDTGKKKDHPDDPETNVTFWRIPWIITRIPLLSPEREQGYTCKLRREDDPKFEKNYKLRSDLIAEVENIEWEEWNSYRKYNEDKPESKWGRPWTIQFSSNVSETIYTCRLTRPDWPEYELKFMTGEEMGEWLGRIAKYLDTDLDDGLRSFNRDFWKRNSREWEDELKWEKEVKGLDDEK